MLVTDNGGAFKSARFAAFIASRAELRYICTRRKNPGQNGVRERAFGSLKYEHFYRLEIPDGQTRAGEPSATGTCSTTSYPMKHSACADPPRSTSKINKYNCHPRKTEPVS